MVTLESSWFLTRTSRSTISSRRVNLKSRFILSNLILRTSTWLLVVLFRCSLWKWDNKGVQHQKKIDFIHDIKLNQDSLLLHLMETGEQQLQNQKHSHHRQRRRLDSKLESHLGKTPLHHQRRIDCHRQTALFFGLLHRWHQVTRGWKWAHCEDLWLSQEEKSCGVEGT